MGNIKVDTNALKKYAKQLKNLADKQLDSFFNEAARALAAEFIQRVTGKTPVGKTSQLHDGWQIESITKTAEGYEVIIFNPKDYASYVEYGHRGVYVPKLGKTLHTDKRFTPGRFMMTFTEAEVEELAPGIVEKQFEAFLKGALGSA